MLVCKFTYVCVCMCVRMCINTSFSCCLCWCVSLHMCVCVCVYAYACAYARTRVCVCVCVCVYVALYKCATVAVYAAAVNKNMRAYLSVCSCLDKRSRARVSDCGGQPVQIFLQYWTGHIEINTFQEQKIQESAPPTPTLWTPNPVTHQRHRPHSIILSHLRSFSLFFLSSHRPLLLVPHPSRHCPPHPTSRLHRVDLFSYKCLYGHFDLVQNHR